MKKVVIVGGGISGLCTAYYLVKEGCSVTVLDQSDMASGASHINAGYLTPSHFIPLAAPGIVAQGLKWMLNPASPLYVKPRLDAPFLKWAWQFAKSATAAHVQTAIPQLTELNLKSQVLYEEMLADAAFPFHYEKKGLLMVYRTEESGKKEAQLVKMAKEQGLEATVLSRRELDTLQPGFSKEVLGGVYYGCDSHMTPSTFMQHLKAWLKEQGVQIRTGEKVNRFKTSQGSISEVHTQSNHYMGDDFVLAAGSWTTPLARDLGLSIPVQGGKGYCMDVHRPTAISLPTILVDAKVAVTPMQGFTRFAGTMEFSGNNTKINKARVAAIAKAVDDYYLDFSISDEERSKAVSGLRPVSPDGLPFIGKTSKYSNLSIATGHAMMGWSLGPITGKLITQTIMDQHSSLNLTPFAPERFA